MKNGDNPGTGKKSGTKMSQVHPLGIKDNGSLSGLDEKHADKHTSRIDTTEKKETEAVSCVDQMLRLEESNFKYKKMFGTLFDDEDDSGNLEDGRISKYEYARLNMQEFGLLFFSISGILLSIMAVISSSLLNIIEVSMI